MQGYCVKCKAKQEIKDAAPKQIQTKRGLKNFMMGICSVCGTKMSVVTKASA